MLRLRLTEVELEEIWKSRVAQGGGAERAVRSVHPYLCVCFLSVVRECYP